MNYVIYFLYYSDFLLSASCLNAFSILFKTSFFEIFGYYLILYSQRGILISELCINFKMNYITYNFIHTDY